jgi:hypothetical protein
VRARSDGLVSVAPLSERLGSIAALVGIEPEQSALTRLRGAARKRPADRRARTRS